MGLSLLDYLHRKLMRAIIRFCRSWKLNTTCGGCQRSWRPRQRRTTGSELSPAGTAENYPGCNPGVLLPPKWTIRESAQSPGTASWVILSRPFGTDRWHKPTQDLRPGLLSARAVQISGLVDPVALILLDKRVLQPVIAKSGWGEGSGRLRNVLSKCFAIELPIVGRFRFFDGRLGFSCPKES